MSNPQDPEQRPGAEASGSAGDDTGAEGTPPGESDAQQPAITPPPAPPVDPNATVQLSAEQVAALRDESVPSDPDDPLVGTLLRNKWQVLGRIGAGSFGTVYKVRDVDGEWIEALKILSVDRLRGPDADAMRKRFLREAQIMKRLGQRSAHIVGLSTYEDDLESGLIYFLMEHVEGRILSDVLLHEGPLSTERAVRIGLQVCDALIAAHESDEPVVHRDLKLENLMLTLDREGEEFIKVLDFGIAKIAEREGDSRLTAAGTLGTPGYAAPEQLRAEEIDGRTDLFAFGVILYSLVTGKNPWLGHLAYLPTNQTYELMAASDRGQVIPIAETGADVPLELEAIIMRLLKRDPDERFQSARELRDALRTFAGMGPTGTGTLAMNTREMTSRQPSGGEPERRLAAVWFADLVGYSTLSSQDEETALSLLDTFHKTARRVIEAGGGRVVQFIGDAVFAEFQSTQRAVVAARDFQQAFKDDTAEAPVTPLLRIGVHVGDVLMAADGDVFGDGVNVAARIQNEAEPDQILVSQDVWRQLKQRRDFGFVSIGERSLKGIGAPVHLFAVAEAGAPGTTGSLALGDPTTGLPVYGEKEKKGRGKVAAAAIIVLIAIAGGGYAATQFGAAADTTGPVGTQAAAPEGVGDGPAAEDSTPVAAAPDSSDATPVQETDPPEEVVDDTPPAQPPAQPTVDPNQGRYERERERVRVARSSALADPHEELANRLSAAERLWGTAGTAADGGRYQEAIQDLGQAATIYEEVEAGSALMRRFDRLDEQVAVLRRNANDPTRRQEADDLAARARREVDAGQYEAALGTISSATAAMAEAAEAPAQPEVTQPPAEAPFVARDVATEVLDRLDAAMEAEDIDRVRGVFPGVADPAGVENFFGFVSNLRVSYSITAIEVLEPRERIDVTVETRYEYNEASEPQSPPPQVYTMERTGSSWSIVAARGVG